MISFFVGPEQIKIIQQRDRLGQMLGFWRYLMSRYKFIQFFDWNKLQASGFNLCIFSKTITMNKILQCECCPLW